MLLKTIAPLVPYVSVGAGLLLFRNAWIALFGYHAGMIAVLLISGRAIPSKQLFHCTGYKTLLLMSIAGASGGFLLYILWPFLSVPQDISSYIQDIGLTGAGWPLFLAYYILANPLLEEYYWRGYLTTSSKRMVPADFLFSGYHLIVLAGKISPVWLVAVFLTLSVTTWFWRRTNERSGGLLTSTLSHLAADTTVIFTIYLMTAG